MAEGQSGCLKGCAIGCAGLTVLVFAAVAFGYFRFVRPVHVAVQRVSEMDAESAEIARRLRELDETYGYAAPDDPSEVALDEGDVERYLAVRREVSEELEAFVRARESVEDYLGLEEGGPPGFREIFSALFDGYEEMARTRLELQRASLAALEAEEMAPGELETLLGLVEWRFLGRDEAAFLGLPPAGRELLIREQRALRSGRMMLGFAEVLGVEMDGRDAPEIRAEIERIRQEISTLREEAGGDRVLHPRTRSVLRGHRAALRAFRARGVDVLATLSEQGVEEAPLERILEAVRSGG